MTGRRDPLADPTVSAASAEAVRAGAGLFRLDAVRGQIEVAGRDRTRWLDGMISNAVGSLEPGPGQSGCAALLLTPKGRIVADLQVLLRGDVFWLETERDAASRVRDLLERYVIADDVKLVDQSESLARFAVEGPGAAAVVETAAARPLPLAADACLDVEVAGHAVVVAAFGCTGESARQLFAPHEAASDVAEALRAAGGEALVEADLAALEVLRIESGRPRLGAELDGDVFPAEARLERAVSFTKGCYTGQEIVARIQNRGQVNHLLVGLRAEGDTPPAIGADVLVAGRRVGEVTSACMSARAGAIALGYVRRECAEPETQVLAGAVPCRVAALPFVAAS